MPSEMYLANWNTYQTAWADIPATERQELLRKSVDQDCVYTDPQSVSHGHEQLIQKMESTQRNFREQGSATTSSPITTSRPSRTGRCSTAVAIRYSQGPVTLVSGRTAG